MDGEDVIDVVVVAGGEIAARDGLQPVGESERVLEVEDEEEDRRRPKPIILVGSKFLRCFGFFFSDVGSSPFGADTVCLVVCSFLQ